MFARLEAWFNTFFLGYAARVSADLATGLVPVALALVTIYIAIYGLAVMRGEASEPVGTFAWKMVTVGAFCLSRPERPQLPPRAAHWTWPTRRRTSNLRCSGKTRECFGLTSCSPASCSRWEQRSSLFSARSSGSSASSF